MLLFSNLTSECIELAGERLLGRMLAAVAAAGDDPQQRLWTGSLAFFEHVEAWRDGWSVLFGELGTRSMPFAEQVNGIRGRVIQAAAELFTEILERRGLDPAEVGGAEPLAIAYVGAGESLANWWLDHPGESPEAMTARLINIGWVGLEGLVTGRRWRSTG